MRFIPVFLTMALLAAPFSLKAENTDGLGMWVWSYSSFSTPQSRDTLVSFCSQHQITHLDIHVEISWNEEIPSLKDPEALRDLLALAGRKKITTSLLRGDPRMFFAKKHKQTLEELRAILAFCQTLPPDALLDGIKYDVEPYLTGEWRAGGEARRAIMQDYLSFLRQAQELMDEETPHLLLGADTPFWWDRDEFITDFDGKRKRFSEHVQDLTDFIVIMSYWRDPRKVLESVEGERRYAEKIEKRVYPSLETIQLKQTPEITFWGVPADEFWNAVSQIQEAARRDPVMGGLRIHNYRGLAEKLKASGLRNRDAAAADKTPAPR
jgi:hypothetical protein